MKKILITIIFTIVMIMGLSIICCYNVNAAVFNGNSVEIFNEDYQTYGNWWGIPVNIIQGKSLWCMEHHSALTNYLSGSQQFYNAYVLNTAGTVFNGINTSTDQYGVLISSTPTLYRYYGRSSTIGLIPYHEDKYKAFKNSLPQGYNVNNYIGDDKSTAVNLVSTNTGLRGMGLNNAVCSIKYIAGNTISSEENQDALYSLTAYPRYTNNDMPRNDKSSVLSDTEKRKGYFTCYEKQYALWEMGINVGDLEFSNTDRGLGEISKMYQNFYNLIHNDYGDDVYSNNIVISDNKNIITTTNNTNIEGQSIATYEIQNSRVDNNGKIILGPYCVDYTVDDTFYDTFQTTDGYEIKFNAIENIAVYNQNKQKITDLGASFYIAYSIEGEETETTRINDDWYENADGASISGFESNKPFYIIINKGSVSDVNLKELKVKIDFQYLENISGTLQEYNGTVNKYYYELTHPEYTVVYTATPDDTLQTMGITETKKLTLKLSTDLYTLRRIETNVKTQKFLAYGNDGQRHYKTYSIVLSSEETEEEQITSGILIEKVDSKTGKIITNQAGFFVAVLGSDELSQQQLASAFNKNSFTYNNSNDRIYFFNLSLRNKIQNSNKNVVITQNGKIHIRDSFTGEYIGILLDEKKVPDGYKSENIKRFLIIRRSRGNNYTCRTYAISNYSANSVYTNGTNAGYSYLNLGGSLISNQNNDCCNCKLENGVIKITVKNESNNPETGIEILKKCEGTEILLSGAKFDVTCKIGNNSYTFTRISDSDGKVVIKNDDINAKGFTNIYKYTGQIEVTVKEKEAPKGYDILQEEAKMIVAMTNGQITGVSSSTNNAVSRSQDGKKATITIYNKTNDEEEVISKLPKIEIRKTDPNGYKLGGAQMSVSINDKYTKSFTTVYNQNIDKTITFSELFEKLLDYNSSTKKMGNNYSSDLINELNNVDKNNAVKLFKAEYKCGTNGTGLTLDNVKDYVTIVTNAQMSSAITQTSTWLRWDNIKATNFEGYSLYSKALAERTAAEVAAEAAAQAAETAQKALEAAQKAAQEAAIAEQQAPEDQKEAAHQRFLQARAKAMAAANAYEDAIDAANAARNEYAIVFANTQPIINNTTYKNNYDTYKKYVAKQNKALSDVSTFAGRNPINTNKLINWLTNKRIYNDDIVAFTRVYRWIRM